MDSPIITSPFSNEVAGVSLLRKTIKNAIKSINKTPYGDELTVLSQLVDIIIVSLVAEVLVSTGLLVDKAVTLLLVKQDARLLFDR
jgi:hypothetical protein